MGSLVPERILAVQILVERKGADPSATTAREAIRELLGLGPRLAELRRRRLLELMLDATAGAPREVFLRYLDRTTLLWNPNKERAWVRIAGESPFEVVHGEARASRFGQPDLGEAEWDHVLVWNREGAGMPEDLRAGLVPLTLLGSGGADLWSARWIADSGDVDSGDTASLDERNRLTQAIGEVTTRGEGFLVNPHYQDHRLLQGPVPLPLWGNA